MPKPKPAVERLLILLGLFVFKALYLVFRIRTVPGFEADYRTAASMELGLIALLGALALARFRVPAVLLGACAMISGGFVFLASAVTLMQYLVTWNLDAAAWDFPLIMLGGAAFVLGGYRLICLARPLPAGEAAPEERGPRRSGGGLERKVYILSVLVFHAVLLLGAHAGLSGSDAPILVLFGVELYVAVQALRRSVLAVFVFGGDLFLHGAALAYLGLHGLWSGTSAAPGMHIQILILAALALYFLFASVRLVMLELDEKQGCGSPCIR